MRKLEFDQMHSDSSSETLVDMSPTLNAKLSKISDEYGEVT